jgi:hypothetical protein
MATGKYLKQLLFAGIAVIGLTSQSLAMHNCLDNSFKNQFMDAVNFHKYSAQDVIINIISIVPIIHKGSNIICSAITVTSLGDVKFVEITGIIQDDLSYRWNQIDIHPSHRGY